jgi:hypothetical protein
MKDAAKRYYEPTEQGVEKIYWVNCALWLDTI